MHRGTFFLNEDELTGVALLTMEEKKIKYLKEVLSSRNNIAMFLEKHIIMVVLVNLFLSWALIALLSLITVYPSLHSASTRATPSIGSSTGSSSTTSRLCRSQ